MKKDPILQFKPIRECGKSGLSQPISGPDSMEQTMDNIR
jgi:hypothetical protein